MDKNEWLIARRKCITGTDIAAICGLSRYKTKIGVWLDKLNLSPEVVENEAMKWGTLLEPVIAQRYAEENNFKLEKGSFIVNGIYGGTPDYLTKDRLVEIKTSGFHSASRWGEAGSDQVPEEYFCQVQWYMMLTDRSIADIVVLIGGQDYRVFTVKRNDVIINHLIKAARSFWENHIVTELRPSIDGSDSSSEYLTSFFPKSRGNMIAATNEVKVYALRLSEAKKQIARLTDSAKEYENLIKEAIGTNDGINDESFKCTWKSTKDSEKIDYASLVKACNIAPDLIKEFTKQTAGYRRFVFSFNNLEDK
jgi:putative phage-type endonuclease